LEVRTLDKLDTRQVWTGRIYNLVLWRLTHGGHGCFVFGIALSALLILLFLSEVLITACASNETASDCQPEEGDPHGALSNAIKEAFDDDPDLSNKDLILFVRQKLGRSGYLQTPQLACTWDNSDLLFIC
jgi:hypothetical protein